MRQLFTIGLTVVCVSALAAPQADTCEQAVGKWVKSRLPEGSTLSVEQCRFSTPVSAGAHVLSLLPDPPLGLVTFEVTEVVKGAVTRSNGSAVVRATGPVAVASAPISHSERFSETNTRFESRDLTRLVRTGYFPDRKSLGARVARGYIAPGQVVSALNSAQPPLVIQGQTVELVRQMGSLRLVAKVRALQNGLLDQWVQVQNPSTGKMVLARVTGTGLVEAR